MRDIISMACPECKRRNYSTTKNKKKTTERLELSKVLPVLPEAHGAQGNEVTELQIADCRLQIEIDADGSEHLRNLQSAICNLQSQFRELGQ